MSTTVYPTINLDNFDTSTTCSKEKSHVWDTPYKFNDYGGERFNKAFDEHTARSAELDAETGLYYYGARYYTPEIGIWLSVDPMSDKYPSLSPYAYCALNPVMLVDPDGREIWIIGDQASVAFNSMQQGTNLQLKMEDGKISHIGGEALNDNDAKLLEAIKSTKVNVQIETTIGVKHGEYHGTTYDESNQTAESTQRVNIYGLKGLEKPGAEGSGIIHEATEGYQMGLLSIEKKDNIHRAGFTIEQQSVGAGNNQGSIPNEMPENPADYKLYEIGHGNATKAPNEMRRKEAINYKNPK